MDLHLMRQQIVIALWNKTSDITETGVSDIQMNKGSIVIKAKVYGYETNATINNAGICHVEMDMASPDPSFFLPKADKKTGRDAVKIAGFIYDCYENFRYRISDIYRG